jgi:hypothetical protein
VPLVNNLQVHDYQFEYAVAAGKWRWTTRLDVSGSNPVYSVRDIKSPYGLLRDSIPIPGTVVQAMSESIDELKANFSPSMLVGPPTSITFEVDEGRGFSEAQSVLLTNVGVYGSILGVSITSSAPYLRSVPANIGNLAVNESGQFDVDVSSTSLLAADSPYSEVITIQDPGATNSPQTVPITIIVRPKPTISASPLLLTFTVVKPLSGAFPSIPSQIFTIQNTGLAGSVLDFDVNKLTGLSDWLTGITPVTGQLNSSDTQPISVTCAPADSLSRGTYTETLRVGGFSTNSYLDVEIVLVVT